MTNLCFDGFGRDKVITTDDAGQWFTPPDVASRLATWARAHHVHRILEPSAGSGALIDAVRGLGVPLDRFNVTAYELDEVYADRLRARNAATFVHHADYLAAPAPPVRFDLALMNPPFEDGADGRFVAKAMDEADRVVALVRLAFLAGKARHEGVWSRCARGGRLHIPRPRDLLAPARLRLRSRHRRPRGRRIGEDRLLRDQALASPRDRTHRRCAHLGRVVVNAARRRLRDARLSLGLTQAAVAARAGVCRSRVSDAELGRWWPHPRTLEWLARACGVSGAWVLDGRDPMGRVRGSPTETSPASLRKSTSGRGSKPGDEQKVGSQ